MITTLLFLIATYSLLIIIKSLKVVPPQSAMIIERRHKFHRVATSRIVFLVPLIDGVHAYVSLKECTVNTGMQEVRLDDGSTIKIDVVLFYKIVDPQKAAYSVNDLNSSIRNLAIDAFWNIVNFERKQTDNITAESINKKVAEAISDTLFYEWGCKVTNIDKIYPRIENEIQQSFEDNQSEDPLKIYK